LVVVKCPSSLVPGGDWGAQGVQSASGYRSVVDPNEKAKQATKTFMCADSNGVQIQSVAVDNDIIAPYSNCNDPLFNDDVVEAFIPSPTSGNVDLHHYLEIEVSPNEVLFASHVANPNLTCSGIVGTLIPCASSGIKIEAKKVSGGYWAYVSVPWEQIVTDSRVLQRLKTWSKVNELKWRGGFFRIDTPDREQKEYTAWSPPTTKQPRACFHQPAYFGQWKLREN
jgi:hypothetical protein